MTINISAQNFAFDTRTITVPAGANVTIVFDNKEGVPHNIAIYNDASAGAAFYKGEIITGPRTISYTFKAPATPGTYFFRCDVHPNMTGEFVVTAQ